MIAQPAEPSARERRLAEALVAVIDGCVSASSVIAEARAVLASPEAPAKEDALEARHARVREAALEFFWALCWQKSQRGGHYWLRLPKIVKSKPVSEAASR